MSVDLTEKYVGREWLDSGGRVLNPNYAFLIGEHKHYNTLVMQGGTRSGKTYAAYDWLLDVSLLHNGIKIVTVRESRNSVERSSFDTFRKVLTNRGIFDELKLNKTKLIYRVGDSEFHFIGAEDEEKAKGVESNIAYLNEGGNISFSVARQYRVRANMRTLIDYNPSYPQSWIYDNILTRSDVAFIKTTYRDNPFLEEAQLEEILWAKENDPEWYKVYGEGERGVIKGQIYSSWVSIPDSEFPGYMEYSRCFVIDFGSEDPSCITEAFVDDINRELFLREHFYSPVYDPIDLALKLYFIGHRHGMDTPIICDSADPGSIKSLRFGFNVTEEHILLRCQAIGHDVVNDAELGLIKEYLKQGYGYIYPVNKNYGKGGKINAVKKVKQYKVLMTQGSINGWREYQLYRFPEDKNTGQPVYKLPESNDHFLDTVIYAVISKANGYF